MIVMGNIVPWGDEKFYTVVGDFFLLVADEEKKEERKEEKE